jgi:hypothetical protein
MAIGPPGRRISCGGGKAPLRRPSIRCRTYSNSRCHRVLAGSASSQRGGGCPGWPGRQRAGPGRHAEPVRSCRKPVPGREPLTPRRAGDVPVRHGGDLLEVVPADSLSAGRAGHASADRVAAVLHPEGRCVYPPVAPGSERAQHRHQFPARGGEAVVVPRRAGLVFARTRECPPR